MSTKKRYNRWYTKIDDTKNTYLFIERQKQWDIDTLVTKKDFEEYEASKTEVKQSFYEIMKDKNACFGEEHLFRQTGLLPGKRFMVCFNGVRYENIVPTLKSRGFQTYYEVLGPQTKMFIVAEENVDLTDAIEYAYTVESRTSYVDNDSPNGYNW